MSILDSMVGYWDLSEASGVRADSSGHGYDLADNFTVTGTTGPGSHNASLFTAANTEWLSHSPTGLAVGDIDFTVALWVKLTTAVFYSTVAAQSNVTAGNQRAWQLYYDDNSRYTLAISGDGTNEVYQSAYNLGDPGTTNWHFIVFWHDSVGNSFSIQGDNGTPNTTAAYTAGVFTSPANFCIGVRDGSTNYHNGAVALFGLWTRILTDPDKTLLFNSGNGMSYAELTGGGGSADHRIRWRVA